MERTSAASELRSNDASRTNCRGITSRCKSDAGRRSRKVNRSGSLPSTTSAGASPFRILKKILSSSGASVGHRFPKAHAHADCGRCCEKVTAAMAARRVRRFPGRSAIAGTPRECVTPCGYDPSATRGTACRLAISIMERRGSHSAGACDASETASWPSRVGTQDPRVLHAFFLSAPQISSRRLQRVHQLYFTKPTPGHASYIVCLCSEV